jgi:glycosyltransferase involved in cell wall biosynthesis
MRQNILPLTKQLDNLTDQTTYGTAMKILWISHLLPYPPKGGVMQRSFNILKEICKYNHVDFLTLYQTVHHVIPENSLEIGIKELSRFCNLLGVYPIPGDHNRLRKMANIAAGFTTKYPYMIWWLRSRNFSKAVREASRKADYDIFYFDTIALSQYLEALPQGKGAIVLNHHNIESQLMHRRSENEKSIFKSLYFSMEGRKREKYERQLCSRFDHNIVVSQLDQKRLEKKSGKLSCSVVPNGVDLEYFKPVGIEQKDNSIIFVGGLRFYPNIAAVRFILRYVWKPLKKKRPLLKFYIVGKFPPEDVKKAAESDPSIIVTGYVDDIRPLMEKAAVYVCPITDGGGTRLKILDALAMKKALVAHPVACEGIDVTDGTDVVLANSPEQFVESIDQLLGDLDRRKALGENGRLLIESKYSYEAIGKDFHNTLTDLSYQR